ncbi:MAG: rRNA pseudouridine synthase [Calditrichaeota bacterium]|nr:MAG: rRNA pseudouridine synthase [Calditrichota bacterium]
MRLNRYLAMAGLGSRRTCDQYIREGRVKINGEVVTRLGVQVDPQRDVVEFDGQVVKAEQPMVYILLHKPRRTVSTVKDERGRRTVVQLVGLGTRIFPVGRLDYNTTGALLLTNDGELTYYLTHPKFEVKKIYRVLLDKVIRPIALHQFQTGIELDGRRTAPCKAREIRIIDNRSYLEVELHEGRNRQIRRMFASLGYEVEELHRLEFAGLRVSDLKPGEWRELTPEEVQSLKKLIAEQKSRIDQNDTDGEKENQNRH